MLTDDWRVVLRSHDVLAVPDGSGSAFLFSVRRLDGDDLSSCTPSHQPSASVRVQAEALPERQRPKKPFVEPDRVRVASSDIDPQRYAEVRSIDEVRKLLHYAHFIPQSKGFTRRHVDTYWPGHTFGGLIELLKAAGVVTFVSPLGAVITQAEGLVRRANDLQNFTRIVFNDITDWAVEWPDGSWTRPA